MGLTIDDDDPSYVIEEGSTKYQRGATIGDAHEGPSSVVEGDEDEEGGSYPTGPQHVPPERDASLMASIDALCDDFFNCKPDILKQFARSRGIVPTNKAQTVSALVDKAYAEVNSTDDLKYTRKIVGDVFASDVRTSGSRKKWTDNSLEASFIEAAAAKHLKYQAMSYRSSAVMARQSAKKGEKIMKKLLRPFQDEFSSLCDKAVGGLHRTYRSEVDDLLRAHTPINILSPFATYLIGAVSAATSETFVGQTDMAKKLVELGVHRPAADDDDEQLLQTLMGMLDSVADDVELCLRYWEEKTNTYGKPTPETTSMLTSQFLSSNRYWELDDVPEWVTDLAIKFGNWEAVVRNDIKLLESAPPLVFHCILQGVTTFRMNKMVYGDEVKGTEMPMMYKNAMKAALTMHFQDEDKVNEALHQLQTFSGIKVRDARHLVADFYGAVDAQLQSSLRQSSTVDKTERIAIILRQVAQCASNAERCSGLYPTLLHITNELHFHLRFSRVFSKLSTKEKKYIRNKPRSLAPMLLYFEKDMNLPPISVKSVAFLSVVLMFMCLRLPATGKPVCERFTSVTGKEEFSVITLVDFSNAMKASDLRVALPPQLQYKSWLDTDGTSSNTVYDKMKGKAVKSASSDIMLLSQAPIIKALDAISKVPWRISRYMLYVQEAITREGYGFGKIRPSFYPLHYTNRKSGEIFHEGMDRSVHNMYLSSRYQGQRDKDWRRISELRSTRVHYLQALRQARALVQYSHVYFPNSLDFRGRMYPLPGRLNHTGSDPFRALLENAEAKPLGKVGVYWLKVHLANKMGMTKLTFDERAQYVDEHISDVVNSAEAPLTGDRWWQEGAEPLQALMACKEFADALKCSQGPENFMSRLPVAVDGSYNGLQHYSAIGRDEYGAKLVNLSPSERPADAYTGILKEMMKSIEIDAKNNMQVAQRCIGSGRGQDKNHIKRKTIKRPIMTQVYGVTPYGMQEQIFQELFRQNFQHGLWTRVDIKEMSAYLREKVLESLGVTFKEAQQCRKWIEDTTSLIYRCQPRHLRNAFCWTTPLGLIVRQPYRVRKQHGLFTSTGFTRISGQTTAPASRKQLSAIAPNIIHSLDATHLAMTAVEMQNRGLQMMAVHDSFWTYACDLPVMSQVLREQFVSLYEEYDPLYELKEQWEELFFYDLRRHGVKLPDPPPRGNLNLNQVLKSPYFFS